MAVSTAVVIINHHNIKIIICTFQCSDGYEVQGCAVRQCEASGHGEWNGSRTQCNILHFPNITTLVPNSRSCDT